MAFKTEKRKVSEIYQRSCRYIIPRYQREYVWGETQWNELLLDIRFTFLDREKLNWSHFIGTIVLNSDTTKRHSEKIKGITDYEIIDGQQRITTLYILFIAISWCFAQFGNKEAEKKMNYIMDSFVFSLSADSEKVVMIDNPKMDGCIKEIVDSLTTNTIPGTKNSLCNAYRYFTDQLKDYDFDKLELLLTSLLEINVVEIVSDQEEEIYNIFEVLNARGQKLKQIELLKNHVMKYLQPKEKEQIVSSQVKCTFFRHKVYINRTNF